MEAKIKVITYEQSRLEYFTNLLKYAQKTYNRLFEKFKDAHYISAGAIALSDAGAEVQFLCDVVEMLEKGNCKQEWISVEDRLPEENERRDEYGELVPFLVCEKYTKQPYRAFYDGTIWGDGLMKIKGITHWMPLPETPKMKGGAE